MHPLFLFRKNMVLINRKRGRCMNKIIKILLTILIVVSLFSGCTTNCAADIAQNAISVISENFDKTTETSAEATSAYIEKNNNVPNFTKSEKETQKSFEKYGELDSLKRCTQAFVCAGPETLPKEKRKDISRVHPTGWNQKRYDFIDGAALYNRCHLVAYCLTEQNANKKNLITGTRYLNTEGMLPFESKVVEYIEKTQNHVLYRVTPDFKDNELVARGVQIEAWSVEDSGNGISFNVYCYNIQPGVIINYNDGSSEAK